VKVYQIVRKIVRKMKRNVKRKVQNLMEKVKMDFLYQMDISQMTR